MKYRPVVLTAILLLAACNGGDKSSDNERKTAAGEVLGGSISDSMLPLDTITSQSPPLRIAPSGSATRAGSAADTAEADNPADAPAEAPAAAPSASPTVEN